MGDGRTLAQGHDVLLLENGGALVARARSSAGVATLDAMEALHRAADHDALPRVKERAERALVFELAPLGTLEQLLVEARAQGETLRYEAALGLGSLTAEAYQAASRASPARAAGVLSAGQVVLDREGRVRFIGLTTGLRLDRGADGAVSPFVAIAPELLRGEPPDAGSDVYAAAHLGVLVAPFLRFPPALGAALTGAADSEALLEAARFFDRHVATHVRAERARSLDVVLARFEAAWRQLGLTWSPRAAEEELAQVARRLLGASMRSLDVRPDGRGFRRGLGEWLAPRGVFAALVEDARRGGPGLDFDEMLAAGWPDERVLHEAGRARVHVAVSTLRKLGLGDWLEHEAGRYRLRRDVTIRQALTSEG